jgi:hypothetical protein
MDRALPKIFFQGELNILMHQRRKDEVGVIPL